MEEIKIPEEWNEYFINLDINKTYKLISEKASNYNIYPEKNNILNAFTFFKPSELKVIIIGQDPYHKKGLANGLSFSVNKNNKIPPSLKNIFKELKNDIGTETPTHGELISWAEQGILLLNTVLTVYERQPDNKIHKIWLEITTKIIEKISKSLKNIVFILWGNNAIKLKKYIFNIQLNNHLILEGGHPSPLNRKIKENFFGRKFFSKTNLFLIDNHKDPIDWTIK